MATHGVNDTGKKTFQTFYIVSLLSLLLYVLLPGMDRGDINQEKI